jgi:hypothetical protein
MRWWECARRAGSAGRRSESQLFSHWSRGFGRLILVESSMYWCSIFADLLLHTVAMDGWGEYIYFGAKFFFCGRSCCVWLHPHAHYWQTG